MNPQSTGQLTQLLNTQESAILDRWLDIQRQSAAKYSNTLSPETLKSESRNFLNAFREAAASGNLEDIGRPEWSLVRSILEDLSASRANMGLTPTETATFVFSLKEPIFELLQQKYADDPKAMTGALWKTSTLLDKLGLFTTEAFQKSREAVISRQQQEMMELSTPVVKLWDGILALPLIGTLDSARTQVVMQNLLQAIVDDSASIAIIDITGVPTVDTLVAQHLLKTVSAARLMGAECLISGIRPQIAQTIIHLGVELADVTTKATLADAFKLALRRLGAQLKTDPKAGL